MTLVDMHGNPMKPNLGRSISALADQGMTSSTFLGPNAPLYPADGVSRFPRSFEFPTGYNIATRPRSRSRMSFYAMKMLIDNYDIAQIAIRNVMNSMSSYGWELVPMDGWDGDVTREVAFVKRILRKPDGVNNFGAWLRKYLKSVLRYDAGTLYKMRLNSGRAYGLKVINGETIAPLIDGWGDRPSGDAPAYVQFVNGITWNWLLADDLIYQPMHPDDDSPYGSPPIEGVVTAANTDLRLQLFLMQTFTEGNIPAGFGIAPESWTPDQVIDFQEAFDAFMVGTPEAKTQIRFIPGGIAPSFPTLDSFGTSNAAEAKWLMWKTAAMFSRTPDDLGFTENSNRSVGESQADVSNKVGDVPLAKHIAEILTGFVQDDLGMPLEFQFDLGGEEEDRLQTAKSDEVYIKNAVVSASEIREMRFGLTDNVGDIVPRFIFTPAGGATPVSALLAATPAVDPESALPVDGTVAPAIPDAPKLAASTGVGGGAAEAAAAPVQKAIEAPKAELRKDATVGVTSATGYTGNPLKSGAETGEDEDPAAEEMAKFRKFAKSRQRLGKWWDFKFTQVDQVTAHRLNVGGYAQLRKAAGEYVAAGVAVLAEDTGRVLMLQRALDDTDPASGAWEFPGGCLEPGETAAAAAVREWGEETGLTLPDGEWTGTWSSSNGIYAGFVLTIPSEGSPLSILAREGGTNPDDPDGDAIESIAWWDPAQLVGNPAIRAELATDLEAVLAAIGSDVLTKGPYLEQAVESNGLGILAEIPDPEPAEPVLAAVDAFNEVAAATGGEFMLAPMPPEDDADPKGSDPLIKSWRDQAPLVPAHQYDVQIVDHYSPLISAALVRLVDQVDVASILDAVPLVKASADTVDDLDTDAVEQAVRAKVAAAGETLNTDDLEKIIRQVIVDGYLTGAHSGHVQLGGHSVAISGVTGQAVINTDWSTWTPGDTAAAMKTADGGLAAALDDAGITVKGIKQTALDRIGNSIAQGLDQGWGSDQIASTIRDDAGSASRADIIAHTETARAQTSAAFDAYRANDVTTWDLLTADDPDSECEDIASANPHSMADTDSMPPIHPWCRCASSPNAPDGGLPSADEGAPDAALVEGE